MPRTIVRIDEQDRRGDHDIHEVEIGSSEDVGPEPSRPPPPPPQAAANVQTDPPPVSPPIPPRRRNNSITEGVGNDVVIEARYQLVIVDQFVQFRTEPGSTQIYGVFEIVNMRRGDIIIFKVKTTSMAKFHVGPAIGILKPHSTGRVTIKVLAGQTMDTIKNDGFLIQATVLPPQFHGAFSSSESDSGDAPNRISRGDFQRLSDIWKEITDVRGTYVEDHRMKARITLPDPRQIIPPLPSPAASPPSRESVQPSVVASTPESIGSNFEIKLPNQDDLRRRLTLVQDQVAVSSDTIEANLEWNTWLLYGLYALVFACTLFLYWSLRHPGNRAGTSQGSSGSQELPIPAPPVPLPPPPPSPDTEQPPTPTPSNWTSCLGF